MTSPQTKNILINYYITVTIIALLVVGVIVLTIIANGSPFDLRNKALDQRRVNDFMNLSSQINSYYNTNNKLPASLNNLNDTYYKNSLKDPETNKLYDYTIVSGEAYKLCTTFSTAGDQNGETITKDLAVSSSSSSGSAIAPAPPDYYVQSYKHNKGYDCIQFRVQNYNKPIPLDQPTSAPGSSITTTGSAERLTIN